MIRSRKVRKLSEKIPVYRIEKKLLVSRASAMSCVLKLGMPESYSLSGPQIAAYYETFNRVVRAIPAGYILHKQDYYTRKTYRRDVTKTGFLARSYEAKFHEREYLNHLPYLIITKHPYRDSFVSNLLTTLVTGRLIRREYWTEWGSSATR